MEDLEARLLKLEAENAWQAELIRALIGMQPRTDSAGDAPLTAATREFNRASQSLPEPVAQARNAAIAALDPWKVHRRLAEPAKR